MPISHGRRPLRLLLPAIGAALFLGAASPAFADADTDVVAQRGDTKLTVADVRDLLDHMDAAARTQLQSNPLALANFVRDRLLKVVLLNEAKAKGFDQLQDVLIRANEARDAVIVSSYVSSLIPQDPSFPSQSEIAATYEANKAKFMLPKQYHLSQIAFPLAPNAPQAAEDEARKKAQDARAQALKPKADFAELARKLSLERNSGSNGGDLGWIREDQLQPGLKNVVAGLAENAISEPVRSQSAWVVLKLLGSKPAGPPPLAEIQDQLVAAMRQSRTQQVSQGYVNDMLRREPIQLNEIDLARRIGASQ